MRKKEDDRASATEAYWPRGLDDNRGGSGEDQDDSSLGACAREREPLSQAPIGQAGEVSPISADSGGPLHARHGRRERVQCGWVKERVSKSRKIYVGYWNAPDIFVNGKRKKQRKEKVLGLKSELTKGQAKNKLKDEVIPQYFASLLPAPAAPVVRCIPTFEQAAGNYLHSRSVRWGKQMQNTMYYIFNSYIIPKLGKYIDAKGLERDYLVTDILSSQVQAFFNGASKRSDSMMKKLITHTRAVFDICIDDDILSKNPARGKTVKPPATRERDTTFLTLEQILALLRTALKWSYRDFVIIRLALVCGLRPSELFSLRVEDVNCDKLTLDETVVLGDVREFGKTKKALAPVPLPLTLQRELAEYIRREGITDRPKAFLFPSEVGTPMYADNYLDRHLKPIGIEAGVGRVTFQILRRTTSTHFQNYGEVKDCQGLLRHANANTTVNIYQQVIPENLKAASTKWDFALSAI